ncbi:auxin-responsive protein SAUR32-like [Rhodamnia argentea]|uniref:Auxin-responsive protein SAUR32-like n=1 Tax=Rhodamnia argentea TaxID=178133 RepID=A0A8B8Q4C7_9MYRT|nr:auxin-responsive protein SAUR32-like [Rhodamnia argentea]XP_048136547.1 auxin-responsive protein SAUR32-like [Rhodamnia argentea]
MEADKGKAKKGLISKTWERCKSIGRGGGGNKAASPGRLTRKTKSWSGSGAGEAAAAAVAVECGRGRRRRVAPEGCFSVYVGPGRQKFVIKTEYANHPLFKALLDEAEAEYGYSSGGPIELPCDVAVFYQVLMEIGSDDNDDGGGHTGGLGAKRRVGCGFSQGYGAYRLLSPSRMITINQF